MLIIAFVFFGIAGLLSAFIVPIENRVFTRIRSNVLIGPITEELFIRGISITSGLQE